MPRRFVAALLAGALLLAHAPVHSQAPSTMSYQGVLTDGGGSFVPNGSYALTFNLYDVASGGSALWSESHATVPVDKGGFSVILGGNGTPIALPFDKPYWLGITIAPGAELSPRVALASSPYGLSLRMPFAGASTSDVTPTLKVTNLGTAPALVADGRVDIGGPAHTGELLMYDATGALTVYGHSNTGQGGSMLGLDETGSGPNWYLSPVGEGGGYLFVRGDVGHFTVTGTGAGAGSSPRVRITGTSSTTLFDSNADEDAAVQLPANAITAGEVLDEPGIAQGRANGTVFLGSGPSMPPIVSLNISTPGPGYIVVEAGGQHGIQGDGVNANYAVLQIDEGSGDLDTSHYFLSGYQTSLNGYVYHPIATRRLFYKSAGTYYFALSGYAFTIPGLASYLWSPTITATYFPTAYGSAQTVVGPADAARFEDARPVAVGGNGAAGIGGQGGYAVDLRELELRVAREQARLAEAQRQLLEARTREEVEQATAAARRITVKKEGQ